MGYLYIFKGGPHRTRTFTWDITASVSGGCVLHGACSALGYGAEFSIVNSAGTLYLTHGGSTYALSSGTGTFSVSVPTEEWTSAVMFAGPFSARVYEVRRVGMTATATLTIGGVSIALGGTIASAAECNPYLSAYARVGFANDFFAGNGAGSLSIQPASLPFAVEAGSASYSGSDTGSATSGANVYSWSWDTDEASGVGASAAGVFTLLRTAPGATIEVDILPIISSWDTGSTWKSGAYAESWSTANRSGTLESLVQALDAPTARDITARIATTGTLYSFTGSGSQAFTHRWRRRWAGGTITTKTAPVSAVDTDHVSEATPLSVQWKRLGEPDTAYQPLGLRLWRWDAMGLEHESSLVIDDGTSLTPSGDFHGVWSAGSGGSVSIASGAVHLTGSAGKTLARSFPPSGDSDPTGRMNGYSRLIIRLKSSAASHAVRLSISDNAGPIYDPQAGIGTSKQWEALTGAADTYTDLCFDLSAEHNGTFVGRASSRFDGLYGTEEQGAHFLSVWASSLTLSGLGAGSYDIDSITLDDGITATNALDIPKVHALQMPVGTGANRLLTALCAGTQTLELVGDPGYGIITAIDDMTGSQITPGWSGVDLAPVSASPTSGGTSGGLSVLVFADYDERVCSYLPLVWLSGAGLMWDGAAWSHTYDDGALTLSGSPLAATLKAQWVVTSFAWEWPEALDSLPGGDAIGAGVIYGGGVWGRILATPTVATDSYRASMGGNAALTLGTGDPSTDTDTVNANTGFYYLVSAGQAGIEPSGAGFGASSTGTITADGSSQVPKPTATFVAVYGRRRVVLVNGQSGGGACLSLAQSLSGRLVRAWADGNIYVEMRSQFGGAWGLADTGVAGECPSAAWGIDGKLLMAYASSGIKFRTSEDEGGTWSVATTIAASGSHPALCISRSGMRYFVWFAGSGQIKLRAYDGTQTERIAARTIVASGAADDCAGLVELLDGRLLLTYQTSSGAVVSVESADGGLTFT